MDDKTDSGDSTNFSEYEPTNDAGSYGHQPKTKNSTAKRNPNRFVGHNQTDLKGILIPEDASAKHYKELKEQLETLGGSKYIPQPTAKEYSTFVTVLVTQTVQTKKANEWIQYQRDLEKVYRLALGRIDDGKKAKLKGLKAWKAIDSSKCIVELLKAVRHLCFQSSHAKVVHPVTNVLRAICKLLCTQQRNLDVASYVKMMKENLDVVKSLGGTLVCKATSISYELETNPLYAPYDYMTYLTLTRATKTAIDHAVEQQAIAALIIKGSDTNNSNFVDALDMAVAFKGSRKPTQSLGNNGNGNNTSSQSNNNGKQRDRKKDESNNQGSNLFTQQGNKTTNLLTDHKGDNESDATSSSSTVSSTSTYSSNSSDDSDSVPDLVPRTNQYPGSESDDDSTSGDSKEDFHFSHDVEHLFIQSKSEGEVNPYWILLDSESSLNLILNPELVNNIQQDPNGGFMNIHCNSAGVSKTNLIADLLGFGVVWFYAKGLANVLSLALVSDQYQVTMDTSIDDAIYVHKEHNGTVLALETVEGKANSLSALDCSRAKKARDMQEILVGFRTSEELVKIIDNNIIQDCPITRRDIKVMSDIYEDINPIPSNILKAYRNVTLCVDIITELIMGLACNTRTHGKYQFLQYIQAHCEDSNNTMKAGMVDARIHQKRATTLPMPQVVIDELEANALEQGMPTGLKFEIDRPITTHDLDTEDNYDDNDASGQSYVDGPDGEDGSLVSVIDKDEAVIDSHLAEEHPPIQDDADNNTNNPKELGVDAEPEELEVYPDPSAEVGVDAAEHTPPDADNIVESEVTAMDVEEPSDNNPLHVTDDSDPNTPHVSFQEEQEGQRLPRLRPRATRLHNNFGSAAGYNPEYRELAHTRCNARIIACNHDPRVDVSDREDNCIGVREDDSNQPQSF
eukprot:jgi/Psemu1/12510/gm1.12510_g